MDRQMTEQDSIREELRKLAEPEFQAFTSKLMPGTQNVLGVRLPALRKIARRIAKSPDWREYLKEAGNGSYEEIMLLGMVIGYAPCSLSEVFSLTSWFLPKIDNWSVCDSFCTGLKSAKEDRDRWWEFLDGCGKSGEEYEIRFVLVMYLMYFSDQEYIDRVLTKLDGVNHPGYYARMAAAWAVSICYIHCPGETFEYLKHSRLDDWTYNKALQKIQESHHTCPPSGERGTNHMGKEAKDKIKAMKR